MIALALACYPFGLINSQADAKRMQPNGGFVVLKSEPATEFRKTANGSYVLLNGTVLAQSAHPTAISLKNCVAKMNAGSVLLLSLKEDLACITDLTEKSGHSVEIEFGNRSLHLLPGRQVWFGTTEIAVVTAAKEEPGRPRLLQKYEVPNTGVLAEFFVLPAAVIDTNDIGQSMKGSPVSKERKLYKDIIKTSAALAIVHP